MLCELCRYSGLSAFVLRGMEPWTFHHAHKDSECTKPASNFQPIEYPKPDGELSFDLLTNLARAGTAHEHDQPSHLRIKPDKADVPSSVSFATYGAPESRFCPAGVYEYPEVRIVRWLFCCAPCHVASCSLCLCGASVCMEVPHVWPPLWVV